MFPLLYLPGTEGAGILAVPLVNTAGVLQMLVPVIFVGKHLAAPLTMEALTGCAEKQKNKTRLTIVTLNM
jgi:hypothetical protein